MLHYAVFSPILKETISLNTSTGKSVIQSILLKYLKNHSLSIYSKTKIIDKLLYDHDEKSIDSLLNTKKAEISKKGRKELKSIIVDEKKFRYKKDKPIFNVLAKKLLSVKKTNEYRSYTMKKATDVVNRERVRQLITKYAKRNRFRVRDIQPAFRRYANSIVLENKHVQGERGLEMIARQKQRLPDFFGNKRSMKLNIRTE